MNTLRSTYFIEAMKADRNRYWFRRVLQLVDMVSEAVTKNTTANEFPIYIRDLPKGVFVMLAYLMSLICSNGSGSSWITAR